MRRRDPFYPRPRPPSASRRRIELLATGGLGALAAALCLAPPGWAAPGSFQGSVATSVNANISTTATTTNVDIYGSRAIIEWNPSDADINATAPVDFQPAGTTATFSSNFLSDFTVLNVVNAPGSRVIGLNGAVKSQVSDGAGGLTTGGAVWFYSRNGFLVGSKANFDVGSLLLTANRPEGAYDSQSSDGYNHEFDNQFQTFSVEAGRSGTITISPGAHINASNYVALIAPHIVQGGAVRANGEIAYVGAESVDMNLPLNGGLFGISITTGTDGVGITHTGSTGGPATTAADRTRNIYMVTVPKNDAVTMLISGSVGYDTAQSATTLADGTLLLAGGDTTVDSGTFIPTSKADLPGTIKISDASFSNNVTAVASHLTVDAAQADLTFAGNANLRGVYDATMTIGAGKTATVGGNLTLQGWGLTDPDLGSQEGGTASLSVQSGATLAIKGSLTIDATSVGFSPLDMPVEQQFGSDGTGGKASLIVNDGTINGGTSASGPLSAGTITVTADATGGYGYNGGGAGKGGQASIALTGGSILTNSVLVSANGQGGGSDSSETASGIGQGGSATIALIRGATTSPSLIVSQTITAAAIGTGGASTCYTCFNNEGQGAVGGAGLGGTAQITMSAGTISTGTLESVASGRGGKGEVGAGLSQNQQGFASGGNGGDATGGTALIGLTGGNATVSNVNADASAGGGQGGNAEIGEGGQSSDTGIGGNGGAAMGGDARVQVAGTSLLFPGKGGGSFTINTNAIGGDGGLSGLEKSGDGGSAGHLANIVAQLQIGTGASVQAGQLAINATATGGNGADYTAQAATNKGGSATGGAIQITQTGGSASFSTTSLQATALRGIAGNRGDNFRGTAGNATGGSILTQTNGGSLSLGTLTLADVSGVGKAAEASTTLLEAGAGQGGSINFQTSGTGVLSMSDASLSAAGHGGDGYIDANTGKAGQILIQAQDSSRINFTGAQIVADASATGGNNAHGVNVGGTATGGSVRIEADDTATIALPASTSLLVGARGGSNAAIGGQGIAGLAQIVASGGTVSGGALMVGAAGTGGDANASGSGGTIQLTSNGTIQFTGGVDLDASGIGSTGAGFGGQIALTTTGGQGLSLADTTLSADGVPGSIAGAGGITIQASTGGITFASLDAHALGDKTISGGITVSGLGAQVHSLGTTQFRTSGNVSFTASGAGGIVADGDLTVTAPGTVTLSHSQPLGQTLHASNATFSVGDFTSGTGTVVGTTTALSINATGAITLEAATSGDVVDLTGVQGVQIGSVTSSGTAVLNASSMLDPNHARINIAAGDSTHAADITINQQATAAGTVTLGATGDIIVAANTTVRSDNLTQLVAGNDILVNAGASVTGAAAPLNATSGSLTLTAGGGESPQPSVHSIIVDGALDGFAAPVTLTADAVQADSGTIRGGSLTATLVSVPFSGSPLDSDGGQLLGNCTGGSICLGGVTLTGALNIGQTGSTPANLVLAGNIDATALNLRSRDLMILGNDQAPITIHSSGQGSLAVTNGAISTYGGTTLTTAGDLLLSANVIQGPVLSAQSGGNLVLSVGHDVRLLDAIAAGQIASPGSSPSPISIAGTFTILGTLQAGAGALDVTAAGISVNRLKAADGVTLHLASGNSADVSLTDASASSVGTIGNVSITGRAITIGKIGSAGGISLTGSGAVQVTTDLAAVALTNAQGASVSIRSLGSLGFESLTSTSGDISINAGGALSATSINSAGALSLASGGDLNAGPLSAQTTIDLNATGLLSINANLTAGGAINLQGGTVSLNLNNATAITNAVATAGDLTIFDGGALTLTSGSATGKVTLTGGGITIGTASAGGLFKAVSTGNLGFTGIGGSTVQLTAQGSAQGNAISGGTLTATGAATLLATDAITIGTNFATGAGSSVDGRSVLLTSTGALTLAHVGATGGGITLRSGGDLMVSDASASGGIDIQSANGLINAAGLVAGSPGVTARGKAVTLGSTGALTVVSATATSGDLVVTAGGNLTVSSGSATGAVRLTSLNAGVTFTNLSNGTDLLLHAYNNLQLGNLTASGAVDLASSNGAIAAGQITAGGSLTARAATNLGFTSLSGAALDLTATSGTITGNSITAVTGANLTAGGAVNIDTNASVAGPFNATGTSIALTSAGSLSLTSATATNGGITLRSANDLILASGNAAGGIDIQTSAGTVTGTNLTAGIAGVAAQGTAVTLGSNGSLRVTSANATAGDLTVNATGNLVVDSGSASGAIRLTSLNGSLTTTTLIPGTDLLLHSANDLSLGNLTVGGAIDLASTTGAINAGTLDAGGNVKAVAATNLGFKTISGGALTLTATGGTLSGSGITATNGATLTAEGALSIADNVTVNGPLSVSGASIALTTPGALSLSSATASNGGITLRSGGNLALTQASATGTLDMQSSGGTVMASGFTAGNVIAQGMGVTLTATGALSIKTAVATAGDIVIRDSGPLSLNYATATGDIDLTGSGITFGSATAGGLVKAIATGNLNFGTIHGGTVQLTAQGGQQGNAITGNGLAATGTATLLASDAVAINAGFAAAAGSRIDGSNVLVNSSDPLAFAHIGATNGAIVLRGGGNIALEEATATDLIYLESNNGTITGSNLAAGAAVSARGTAVTLESSGAMKIAFAIATAGDLAVNAAGDIAIGNGSASGAIRLTSANGGLTATTLTPGTDLLLHSAHDLSLGDVTLGGAIDLASTNGAINAGAIGAGGAVKAVAATHLGFTTVAGSTLTLTATGGTLTGNGITATNGATLTAQNALAIDTNVAVSGPLNVSGSSIALTTPGALTLAGATATNGAITLRSGGNLALMQASATGALDIQSSGGAVTASGFAAGGGVTARGTAVTLTAAGPLTVASAVATAGDLQIHDAGALTLTSGSATGGVDLTGSGITVGSASAGGLFKAVATGNLGFTSLSGGTVQLTAQGGLQGNAITGTTLSSTGAATLLATDAVTVGTNFATGSGSSVDGSTIALTSTGPLALAHAGAASGNITLHSGGDLTLAQGIASGGIDIRSSGGIVNASGLVTGSAGVTASGTNVTLAAPRALKVAVALASAGDLTVTAAGDLVITAGGATGAVRATSLQGSLNGSVSAGGDLALHSAASLTLGDLIGNGAIDLASSGGAISTGAVTAKGDISASAATDLLFSSLSGRTLALAAANGMLSGTSINATNGASLSAAGAVAISNDVTVSGPFTVSGGSVALTATGPLSVTSAHANAGDLTIRAANGLTLGDGSASGSVTLASSAGDIAIDTLTAGNGASLTAAGAIAVNQNAAVTGPFSATGLSVAVRAANGLTVTNATATGGDLTLTALDGNISASHLSATGAARLTATGAIQSGDISAGGGVTAAGSSIDLAAPGALTLTSATASAGDLIAQAVGDLTLLSGTATRSISLTSTGGAVSVHDASVGGVQTLRSLAAAAANSGDIAINAATNATLDGTVYTGGAINVAAAGANVTGSVIGRTISFATRGVMIGGNARIGQAGTTTTVTFANSGTQRSFIGGTSGDGYLLTAAGLGRVQADAIILNLPAAPNGSAANPDVTINDLTLHGSTGTATGTLANLTSSGSFTINTPGRVRVSGKLLLTDLAPTNSASIIAGPEIDVISPAGAILMTDSSGAPTGSLTLAAQRIIVASQSAQTDLASISGTDARSTRLATNDGPVADQGYLAADHLNFRIASLLDVQNSGGVTPEARRGVTAGAGGIDIAVTAPGTPEIILNGRQSTPAAFTALIRVAAADGSFTPVLANGSTVNGCLVTTGCNTTPPTDTLLSLILPQQDVVGMVDGGSDSDEDDKKQKDSKSNKPGSNDNRPLITIVKANPYGFGSIIDQPVTGTPNDDLWIDQPVIGVGNVTGDDPHR